MKLLADGEASPEKSITAAALRVVTPSEPHPTRPRNGRYGLCSPNVFLDKSPKEVRWQSY